MFPDGFIYRRAESVDDAIDLLAEHSAAETVLLAGGHSLLPTMKTGLASPDVVVDISRLDDARGIDTTDGTIEIGALTSYAAIEGSAELRRDCPVVAEAAAEVGDVQVRNAGTIGGNLAHADPASDMTASVLAADATITVRGPDGSRSIAAEEFFQGIFETDLAEGELLTGIEVPTDAANTTSAYVKRPSPSSGYPIVGVAAAVETADDTVENARLAVTGATDHAVRLGAVEEALTGETLSSDTIATAAEHATDDLGSATLMDNDRASSEFRAQLLEQYTERALGQVSEHV
ncbi:FAD binding domain-containing protein [Salinigranum salinum]|uniref:FAD binding domain-containing protein n=1 Tax=Salinigranum salinum TaxID=1364937 RepID=UPI001260E86B|nr:xanthine dehydrogenase family protein subunit M [Salinigranum salinum]